MTDGTMRQRALRFNLESLEIECPHSPLPGFSPEPCADCTVGNLLDFAAAEVSRAVQECIETQCAATCDDSEFECIRGSYGVWYHEYIDDDGIERNSDYEVCCVSVARELLYQKQLANKEEER